MASNTRVKELFYRASEQLQDLSPQFVRWSQRFLVAATDDGQRALAKYLPFSCSRVDTIKLVPGTRQSIELVVAANIKPGDGSVAVDLRGNRLLGAPSRNMGATGLVPGRAIRAVDRATLDVSDPYWHIRTAKAVTQAALDALTPKVFYVSPGVPADTDVWVDVAWIPDPVELDVAKDYGEQSTDLTTLSVDDRYVDDLLNYILARSYMRDAEYAGAAGLAGVHTQLFVSSVNQQAVAAGLPNPNLKGLPMAQAGA